MTATRDIRALPAVGSPAATVSVVIVVGQGSVGDGTGTDSLATIQSLVNAALQQALVNLITELPTAPSSSGPTLWNNSGFFNYS